MSRSISKFRAVVFDLDGVITDTAHYHYLAWKALAILEGLAAIAAIAPVPAPVAPRARLRRRRDQARLAHEAGLRRLPDGRRRRRQRRGLHGRRRLDKRRLSIASRLAAIAAPAIIAA